VSRRDSAASRSRPRNDGKIDVQCPQCAAAYRVPPDKLDSKIECADCHRVFIAKKTAGKRLPAPDHTRVYVGFGAAAVAIVGILVLMSRSGNEPPKVAPAPASHAPAVTLGDNLRSNQLVKWARAISDDNRLVLQTHSDVLAIGRQLGVTTDTDAVMKAMQSKESARYLRELTCDSAYLCSQGDLTNPTGKATVFVTPKPGDLGYKQGTRGEIEVTFRMDGEQVKVTGWMVTLAPTANPNAPPRPAPAPETSKPAAANPGKGPVPAPVPHWSLATTAQKKKADDTVAMLLQSASPNSPGDLFDKATRSVMTIEDKKAVVPRALNAMFELYSDVATNNKKLGQLDRALHAWTGCTVGYDTADSVDANKDRAAREAWVRQWFGYWTRYANGELPDFLDGKAKMPAK